MERPDNEFLELVEDAITSDKWVVDGNYSIARGIVWPRANTIIWLNYPFMLVLYRAISRSVRRVVAKERLFADNVESFGRTFLSKESIILWVIQIHKKKKLEYSRLLESSVVEGKEVVILTSQKAADKYLGSL